MLTSLTPIFVLRKLSFTHLWKVICAAQFLTKGCGDQTETTCSSCVEFSNKHWFETRSKIAHLVACISGCRKIWPSQIWLTRDSFKDKRKYEPLTNKGPEETFAGHVIMYFPHLWCVSSNVASWKRSHYAHDAQKLHRKTLVLTFCIHLCSWSTSQSPWIPSLRDQKNKRTYMWVCTTVAS